MFYHEPKQKQNWCSGLNRIKTSVISILYRTQQTESQCKIFFITLTFWSLRFVFLPTQGTCVVLLNALYSSEVYTLELHWNFLSSFSYCWLKHQSSTPEKSRKDKMTVARAFFLSRLSRAKSLWRGSVHWVVIFSLRTEKRNFLIGFIQVYAVLWNAEISLDL